MLILLAEDDPKLRKLLGQLLKKDGYQVDLAENGREAIEFAESIAYDMVILDWMMPEISGIQVCSKLRQQGFGGGILLLTAKDQLSDKVTGLDAGADDYLVKPFSYDELAARIRSMARRSRQPIITETRTIKGFSVDIAKHSVSYQDTHIPLSAREFQLFELMLRNVGIVLSRGVLIDKVWGIENGEITDNNLDAFIRLLRRKLSGLPCKIVNVRGVGYLLEVPNVP